MKYCLSLPEDWTPGQVSFLYDLVSQLQETLLEQHGDILGPDQDADEYFDQLLDHLAWEATQSLRTNSQEDDIPF